MAYTSNVRKYFQFKSVTPSSLKNNNLISFSYRSPNGVHDKNPLVYVVEKKMDKFYGFNVHYDSSQLTEVLQNMTDKVDEELGEQYFEKYPNKVEEFKKKRKLFTKDVLSKQDLKEFSMHLYKPDLEIYQLDNPNSETLRCYLFKRMNNVSKLIYKA